MINSYGLLLLAVMLSGIGVAGYHPEGSKLTYLVSDEAKAGASMSIFSVGGNLGLGIGPVFATFLLGFSPGFDLRRCLPGLLRRWFSLPVAQV